jgi:hypothetical protein
MAGRVTVHILLLICERRPGINPPLSIPEEEVLEQKPIRVYSRLQVWVRVWLVLMAFVIAGVFAVALVLDPYQGGKVWNQGTHQQLGLQPCNFLFVTGMPCPSCGMSTSFALLVRGDVWNSLCANFVGTMLALVCLGYIPWAMVSAWLGRPLFMISIETNFLRVLVAFLILMLLRWGVVVLLQLLGFAS